MPDRYESYTSGLESPATHGFSVTPSDSADLPETTRALFVGTSGAVSLVLASGAEIVLTGVLGGSLLPLRAMRVRATGTTAASIVGLV
jgi:hypothetical protein